MEIEIVNHPSQARHPITDDPLWEGEGDERKPVPLFPDQQAVKLDGILIAYVGPPPKRNICYIIPATQLGGAQKTITEAVRKQLGGDGVEHAVAPRQIADVEVDDDDFDEDDG